MKFYFLINKFVKPDNFYFLESNCSSFSVAIVLLSPIVPIENIGRYLALSGLDYLHLCWVFSVGEAPTEYQKLKHCTLKTKTLQTP